MLALLEEQVVEADIDKQEKNLSFIGNTEQKWEIGKKQNGVHSAWYLVLVSQI